MQHAQPPGNHRREQCNSYVATGSDEYGKGDVSTHLQIAR